MAYTMTMELARKRLDRQLYERQLSRRFLGFPSVTDKP
jgi:hypothetical protein